jgi:hypothetical protein
MSTYSPFLAPLILGHAMIYLASQEKTIQTNFTQDLFEAAVSGENMLLRAPHKASKALLPFHLPAFILMLKKPQSPFQVDLPTSNMSQTTGSNTSSTDLPAISTELSQLTQDDVGDGGQDLSVEGPENEANLPASESSIATLPNVSSVSTSEQNQTNHNNVETEIEALNLNGLPIGAEITQEGMLNYTHFLLGLH